MPKDELTRIMAERNSRGSRYSQRVREAQDNTATTAYNRAVDNAVKASVASHQALGNVIVQKSLDEHFVLDNPRFGEFLGEGSTFEVVADNSNPEKVLKIFYDRGFLRHVW